MLSAFKLSSNERHLSAHLPTKHVPTIRHIELDRKRRPVQPQRRRRALRNRGSNALRPRIRQVLVRPVRRIDGRDDEVRVLEVGVGQPEPELEAGGDVEVVKAAVVDEEAG